MSRFFVGQRVKKVRGVSVGVKGVVCGFDPICYGTDVEIRLLEPAVDEVGIVGNVGDVADCCAFEWEPILPEGAAPSEFTTLHDLLTSLSTEVTP